jgi:hypothetical protein
MRALVIAALMGLLAGCAQTAPAPEAGGVATPLAPYEPESPARKVGQVLLAMTVIGLPIAGWLQTQRQQEQAARAFAYGNQALANALAEAGSDPEAQRAAIVQTLQQLSQNPALLADNPNLISQLLQQTQAMATLQPSVLAVSPGSGKADQDQAPAEVQSFAPRTSRPGAGAGEKVYDASECIGPVIRGRCHGTILPNQAYHPTCHGAWLNGECTGPMF